MDSRIPRTDPDLAPPNIGKIDGDYLKADGADIVPTLDGGVYKVGWAPHRYYPLILIFDEPGVLISEPDGTTYMPQSFEISPYGVKLPEDRMFIVPDEMVKSEHSYSAILVSGAHTYITLKGASSERVDVPPRRPRIRVGDKIDS